MNAELFVICDAATQGAGKLNILGAFDTIYAPSAPIAHPHCSLAMRLRMSRIEQGEHSIRINIIDEDGNHVVPALTGKTNVVVAPDQDSAVGNIVLTLAGLRFQDYGRYAIDLMVDNNQIATMPLFVKRPPGVPAPPVGA